MVLVVRGFRIGGVLEISEGGEGFSRRCGGRFFLEGVVVLGKKLNYLIWVLVGGRKWKLRVFN